MKSFLYDEKKEKELKDIIEQMTQVIEDEPNNAYLFFARALQYYQLSQQYYDVSELFFEGDKKLYYKYVNCAYSDIETALKLDENIDDYAPSFKLLMLKKLKKWKELVHFGMSLYNGIGCTDEDISLLGEAFFKLKDAKNCIKFYSYLIDNYNNSDVIRFSRDIFYERGLCYFILKEYELSLKDFFTHKKISKYNSEDGYLMTLIADCYLYLNKFSDALKYYDKSISLEPDNSEHYFSRGVFYCDYLHEYEKANEDIKNAIEYSDDEIPRYYHYLGYTAVHLGQGVSHRNPKLAISYYDMAIDAYKKEAELTGIDELKKISMNFPVSLKNELLEEMNKS